MASRVSRTQVVDVEYDDPRTGERVYERKVQEVPWEELSNVRNRELALVRRESPPEPEFRWQEDRSPPGRGEEEYAIRRVQRSRYPEDNLAPRRRDDYYDRRGPRRGAAAQDDDSDSESSREQRRRRRRREERRARSETHSDTRSSRRGAAKDQQPEEDGGKLWYSLKDRKDGNIVERTFDSSYDGLIAAAAGAALGAITVRSFDNHQGSGEDSKKKQIAKLVGGAVAGAAVLNAGENWYRVFTEEREERKEAKQEEKSKERNNGFMSKADALGGAAQAIA